MAEASPVAPTGPSTGRGTGDAARRRLARLLLAESGVAALEFAFILPILVTFLLGGVEVTSALIADRKLTTTAAAIGDLVSRAQVLTEDDLDKIFDIAAVGLFPADTARAGIVVTAVDVAADGKASVGWSRSEGTGTARAKGSNMAGSVPESLLVPGSQVIMTEGDYAFTPAIGYVITGTLDLAHDAFHVPRNPSRIALCSNDLSVCE